MSPNHHDASSALLPTTCPLCPPHWCIYAAGVLETGCRRRRPQKHAHLSNIAPASDTAFPNGGPGHWRQSCPKRQTVSWIPAISTSAVPFLGTIPPLPLLHLHLQDSYSWSLAGRDLHSLLSCAGRACLFNLFFLLCYFSSCVDSIPQSPSDSLSWKWRRGISCWR